MANDAEALAKAFHEAYERLAPSFGYETRKESAVPWEQVPENNQALMTAVCAEVVGPLVAEFAEARRELHERDGTVERWQYAAEDAGRGWSAAEVENARLEAALEDIERAATRGKVEVEGVTVDRPAFVAPNIAAHHFCIVRDIARAARTSGGEGDTA